MLYNLTKHKVAVLYGTAKVSGSYNAETSVII